ncbi:MAG: hypothetical protein MI810_03285 [Flavobacteriales bacterium]|jgi:natural product precursor|nr:hypothetical protein [Flavobacteriales bacterium]
MKKVNNSLFEGMKEMELSDSSMNMILGGQTTDDCTADGRDCGDWNSKGRGHGYNGDNVVTDREYDNVCSE